MMSQALKKSNPARLHKRFYTHQKLVVTCEGAGNLSLSGPDSRLHGMFINTPIPLAGTVLKLAFRLTRVDVKICVRGEVRYCMPCVGVGVESLELSTDARAAIEKEIEKAKSERLSEVNEYSGRRRWDLWELTPMNSSGIRSLRCRLASLTRLVSTAKCCVKGSDHAVLLFKAVILM
jgi:hypothetical protein